MFGEDASEAVSAEEGFFVPAGEREPEPVRRGGLFPFSELRESVGEVEDRAGIGRVGGDLLFQLGPCDGEFLVWRPSVAMMDRYECVERLAAGGERRLSPLPNGSDKRRNGTQPPNG